MLSPDYLLMISNCHKPLKHSPPHHFTKRHIESQQGVNVGGTKMNLKGKTLNMPNGIHRKDDTIDDLLLQNTLSLI